MRKLIIIVFVILVTSCLVSSLSYAATDVGSTWGFWGDSQTDDLAADAPRWINMVAPSPVVSYWNGGQSASSLYYGIGRYEAYSNNGDFTWVHFQESGSQNHVNQIDAETFGDTFDAAVASILTNSPNAAISYETAFSFGREAEAYRDWGPYNTELRSRIATLEAAGTTVILAETDANIKALQTAIGDPSEVWCQSDEGCAYHYKDLGNLMVAFSVWAALGYTADDMVLTDAEILALDSGYVATALEIAFAFAGGASTTTTGTGHFTTGTGSME